MGIKGSLSGWQLVTSAVPQGSVLGPQLFTIYINDLEGGTEGTVAKFADDTKICRGTGSVEEAGGLQKDLDRLGEWAKKWQMEYNVESVRLCTLEGGMEAETIFSMGKC